MNKWSVFFFIGLIMFMSGIYLSTIWVIVGTLICLTGGYLLGVTTYFTAIKNHKDNVPKSTFMCIKKRKC